MSASILLLAISPTFFLASGLRINLSQSMPRGVYRIIAVTRPFTHGDIVAVCPPVSAAALGRQRGYLGLGSCTGNTEPLVKVVVALHGDTVSLGPRGVMVNGRTLPESAYLRSDTAGRPLAHWSCERCAIPAGKIWLYAPSWRSWDSRYWGPVSERDIKGKAVPIFAKLPEMISALIHQTAHYPNCTRRRFWKFK
ncbi:MAG: conjugative transfer signal peptidase TraF [Candidatus Eremiobacter antarcticus]|nr:MAG: conjugative transfer signal peptidase TraF [Candidatus Eremiobacter sp. RRmetagenome_bin22]